MPVAWFTLEQIGVLVRAHRADDSLGKAVAKIVRAELVVIDDIGLLPVGADAAEGLYRIVEAAYERNPWRSRRTCTQRLRRAHAQNTGHRHRRPAAAPRPPLPNQRRLRAPGPSPARERSQTPDLTTASTTGAGHTLMGRFVSATGQFLLATYGHYSRPPTGSFNCPLTPLSLDFVVIVAAASREAIDAGEFELVVGPTVGSAAAGRMLGRFSDFVPDAPQALAQVAAAEAERSPGRVVAELVYQPRARRLGNVSTRLNLRRYEIAIDLPPSTDPDHTIGVDELVVGVRDGRFRLRWTRTGEDVMITAGHMLTSTRAPATARFLSEVGRHQTRQLSAFSWGPAASFPFLPRVRCGHIVLSLAQWRLRADSFPSGLNDAPSFRTELDTWRTRWDAPAALVVAAGDHRSDARSGPSGRRGRTAPGVALPRFGRCPGTVSATGPHVVDRHRGPSIRGRVGGSAGPALPLTSPACRSDGRPRGRPQAARQRLVVRQAVLPFRSGD